MDRLKSILIGIGHAPRVVAAIRALVLYALPLAISILAAWLAGLTDPRLLGIPLVAIPLVRALGEAVIDEVHRGGENIPPGGAPPPSP